MEKKSKVTEEEATATIGDHSISNPVAPETNLPLPVTTSTASTVSTASTATPPAAPTTAPVKAKRIPSEKQRLNYLAANKRRVQIFADAKILRVAAASEKAREKAAPPAATSRHKRATAVGPASRHKPPQAATSAPPP
ncbi:hypothetical protein T492DRAFT_845179 [Pavlovales sp. CCMP2436]|nr:hypothetical protein T492DRAFT_845179 [Pavlovales sp. CCMP2436]